jgi:hypothetical protein
MKTTSPASPSPAAPTIEPDAYLAYIDSRAAPAAPCPSPSHLPLVPPVGVTVQTVTIAVREDRKTGQFVPMVNVKDVSPTSFDRDRALEIARESTSFVPAPVSPSLPAPSYAIIVYDAEYPTGWRVHSTNQTKKDAEWDATGMNAVVEKSFRHPETGIYAIVVSNKVAAAHEIRPPAENGSTPSVSVEDKLDYIRSLASLHNEDGDFRFPSELSCYKIQQLALELKSPFSALKAEVARLTGALQRIERDSKDRDAFASDSVLLEYIGKAARSALSLVKGDAK